MDTDTTLHLALRGRVGLLTLNRPPANAINHAMLRELRALLPRLAELPGLVVTGTGRFFSAGLDLFEVFAYEDAEAGEFATAFDDVIAGLFALPVPVIAAVNGHAVAGGAVLAACADFRLMADDAGRAGLTELQVGVPFPASALEAVRWSCAGPHLGELLYGAQTYPPVEAMSWRLVDRVVPAADLLTAALVLAEELASRPAAAFQHTKRTLRAEALSRMAAARRDGQDPVWQVWRTPETRAAMMAYRARIERRPR